MDPAFDQTNPPETATPLDLYGSPITDSAALRSDPPADQQRIPPDQAATNTTDELTGYSAATRRVRHW